jgi:hypothetical protein
MSALQLHPLCTLFPRIEGAEFEALKADIGAHGLRHPIVVHAGMILDGGNRYRACIEVGVEPQTVEFDGGNLVSFVLSSNLHRRHLSPGQQAAIVASAQDWARAQTVGNPQLRNVAQLATASDRAAISGASHRTQQMADKVAKEAPELAKRVAHGEVSLPQAVKQLSKHPSELHGTATEAAARTDATAINSSSRIDRVEQSSQQDGADDDELMLEMDSLRMRLEQANRELDSLRKGDLGTEIQRLTQLLLNAENRIEQFEERMKDLKRFGEKFDALRKLLKVRSDRDVVGAVRKLVEAQQ